MQSQVAKTVSETVDRRFLSFLNTHFAIIALLAPWIRVESGTNYINYDIWQILDNTNEDWDGIKKTKSVVAFVAISFIFAVFSHIIITLGSWFSSIRNNYTKWANILLILFEMISSVIALALWADINDEYKVNDNYMTTNVGFAFTILHMCMSTVLVTITYLAHKNNVYEQVYA